MSTSNTPAEVPDNDASEGGGDASGAKSTKEQWGEKVEVAEDATTSAADLVSSMPPSFYDVNDSDDEMMHAKMKPFTYKSQGSDGASQAEEVTADATPKPAQQQHMSGESPNDSENAPIARLPTNSIVPTGHQRARAPQQGHSNRASILPAVLQRSTGRQNPQTRRRDHANRASLISAIIQRNTAAPTNSDQFQGSEVTYDSQRPVTAVLVDEEDIPSGEIVEAQAVGFFERKWKLIVFVVVVVAGALLAL